MRRKPAAHISSTCIRFKHCKTLLNRQENSSRKRTSISKNNRKFFRGHAAFPPACFSESIFRIDNQKI
ncbi:hypothetical protein A8H34_04230 [Burkholderia thailandensis]|nr:hypothetical protein A8H38_04765 [Burkholderia thailandensis]PNE83425.1 hypothetical protein A8H34_04230 [Burkholderia thailandensis]PNE89713.1 hypothetical protein A8H30_05995 [Burkholderia thailandensis]